MSAKYSARKRVFVNFEPTLRYGGTLTHYRRDEDGPIEVVEIHGVRNLHFGTRSRQSAMSLAEPEQLELPYVRAMLAGLLFTGEPRRALVLGIGGGSLAGFLFHQFPQCRVDAVELRPAVVEVAHRYFHLPHDPRLCVHIGDAGEYITRAAATQSGIYDHIFVDIFVSQGLARPAQEDAFFDAASHLLHPEGMFAINLWGTHPLTLRHVLSLIRRWFEGAPMRLPVAVNGNVIAYGRGSAVSIPRQEVLLQRARQLEVRLGIAFPRLLSSLSILDQV